MKGIPPELSLIHACHHSEGKSVSGTQSLPILMKKVIIKFTLRITSSSAHQGSQLQNVSLFPVMFQCDICHTEASMLTK